MAEVKEKAKGVKAKLPDFIQGRLRELILQLPDSGEVDVRLKNPKSNSITLRSYTDQQSGELLTFFDRNGNPRTKRYSKKVLLNLERLEDRIEYVLLKNHPEYMKPSNPLFILIDRETQADDNVSRTELAITANQAIMKLGGTDLRRFARLILTGKSGIKITDQTSEKILKSHLYDQANLNPRFILDEYNDERRYLREIMREGLDKGIFTERHGTYSYGSERIGTSFETAVEWLKKNEDLLAKIETQLAA
jgi:hypothetical protein